MTPRFMRKLRDRKGMSFRHNWGNTLIVTWLLIVVMVALLVASYVDMQLEMDQKNSEVAYFDRRGEQILEL